MFVYLPLLAALGVLGVFLLVPHSRRLDASLARAAYALFDGDRVEVDLRRERRLRMAAIGTPYREYAVKTRLYAFGSAFAGAVAGAYLGAGILALSRALGTGEPVEFPSPGSVFDAEVFVFLLGVSAVVGAVAGAGAHALRWQLPALRADTRSRHIDAGMPRMVAFVYALTRGGMSFPDVLRTLARNEDVFGEGAAEVGVAVRDIDLFGADLVTAVQDLSQRTPSEGFETFTENLSSVLQSGRNVSGFLHEQYERYRSEAEEQQQEIVDLLATTAEVYVTTVVAGVLFLVTILLIIGLTVGETLVFIRFIAYVLVPAANLLFLVYLADVTGPLRAVDVGDRDVGVGTESPDARRALAADGGADAGPSEDDRATKNEDRSTDRDGDRPSERDSHGRADENAGSDRVPAPEYARPESAPNHDRLRAHERLRELRRILASPVQSAIARPTLVLYVTVPIALVVTAWRLRAAVDGGFQAGVLDDVLVQAALFLLGTFAVVYEVHRRRLRRLEGAVPELLERLASLNEAGISVVSSFDRVRRGDVGALDAEVDRIWRDVQWGATVAQALERFENRVRTPSVTRVVTLVTNAMRASNEIGPVLRIAAEQARADLRLRRQRRQTMFTYLVVIYVSFVVFLVVIAALDFVLVPNLPEASAIDAGTDTPSVGAFNPGDVDAYRLAFFHTAIVQSTFSGLVGGMMAGGSIKDGVKHSTVMLSVTYALMTLLG